MKRFTATVYQDIQKDSN